MTKICTGTPWNFHVGFDPHQIPLISKPCHQECKSCGCGLVTTCSFTPCGPQSVSWHQDLHEETAHKKGMEKPPPPSWKVFSGSTYSLKSVGKEVLFILCRLAQVYSMPVLLLSLWLLPIDKYVLLQSVSSIFKKTDYTFFFLTLARFLVQDKLCPLYKT